MAELLLLESMLRSVERRQAFLNAPDGTASSDNDKLCALSASVEMAQIIESYERYLQQLSAADLQELRIHLCQSAMRQLDRIFEDASV